VKINPSNSYTFYREKAVKSVKKEIRMIIKTKKGYIICDVGRDGQLYDVKDHELEQLRNDIEAEMINRDVDNLHPVFKGILEKYKRNY
jgi:hypothetical protein